MASLPGSATLPPVHSAGGQSGSPAVAISTLGRGRARPGRHVSTVTVLSSAPGVSSPTAASSLDNGAANWVEATAHFFWEDTRPIMLFDGVCNLCTRGVQFMRDADRKGRISYTRPCRVIPAGCSCEGQGELLTTSQALYLSRKTGSSTISCRTLSNLLTWNKQPGSMKSFEEEKLEDVECVGSSSP